MNKTFTIRRGIFGFEKSYNMVDLGWTFSFNNEPFASGQCSYSTNFRVSFFKTRNIHLSEYLALRINENLEWWRQVMLHEIAHAIDVENRGTTDHNNEWQTICDAIGCDGSERVNNNGWVEDIEKNYLVYCESCGWEDTLPELYDNIKNGQGSCAKCEPDTFNADYIIKWKKLG